MLKEPAHTFTFSFTHTLAHTHICMLAPTLLKSREPAVCKIILESCSSRAKVIKLVEGEEIVLFSRELF